MEYGVESGVSREEIIRKNLGSICHLKPDRVYNDLGKRKVRRL